MRKTSCMSGIGIGIGIGAFLPDFTTLGAVNSPMLSGAVDSLKDVWGIWSLSTRGPLLCVHNKRN